MGAPYTNKDIQGYSFLLESESFSGPQASTVEEAKSKFTGEVFVDLMFWAGVGSCSE